MHIALVKQLKRLIPPNTTVIFLGDGEFDGANLIKIIQKNGWLFVLRTSKNRILVEQGEAFCLYQVAVGKRQHFRIPQVHFAENDDLIFDAVIWWKKKYQESIYLVTNIELAPEATYRYKKRFKIETMFSDKKSLMGLADAQVRSPESVARNPQFTVAVYSLLLLASINAYGPSRTTDCLPDPKWHKRKEKNNKRPSTLDILSLFRREIMNAQLQLYLEQKIKNIKKKQTTKTPPDNNFQDRS